MGGILQAADLKLIAGNLSRPRRPDDAHNLWGFREITEID
jgi:hypothetical protein